MPTTIYSSHKAVLRSHPRPTPNKKYLFILVSFGLGERKKSMSLGIFCYSIVIECFVNLFA
jgi:hypothetical protein